MEAITYNPIGVIRSPFKELEGMPIQPSGAIGAPGTVELDPEFAAGLKDLSGFSHIILVYHFHQSAGYALEVKPCLDTQLRGVFATRAPKRPNSIGLSIVRLVRVEGSTLYVEDMDILDGTPLLDVKPYIPEVDTRSAERIGWLSEKVQQIPQARADKRSW
ncbi:MAG: tRNA (N6-threonylcarbamoyladenosine(37)-N6)-methyltransferase TrmO [Desulfomonilaceae bacterium]